MLQYRVQTSAKVTPHGRTRLVNTKKRLGKLSEVQMSKISISQILCSTKFHFPYFSKFKFSGTQKTHFREYPFSRIPILSVVKVSELRTPFPLFSETHFRKFEKVAFYENQIWTFMNKTKHPEHKTNKLPLDKRT